MSFYLIGINLLLFITMRALGSEAEVWKFGSLHHPLITLNGEYYRFVTAYFLHAASYHIFFNMLSLFLVGPFIENVFGKINFFVLYMMSGLVSTLASYWITSAPEALGASGAIFGIVGGLTYFLMVNKESLVSKARKRLLINLYVVIGLNLAMGFLSGLNVDNAGHIGGLLSGAVIAVFLKPEMLNKQIVTVYPVRLALFFLVLTGVSFIWGGWVYVSESMSLSHWQSYF